MIWILKNIQKTLQDDRENIRDNNWPEDYIRGVPSRLEGVADVEPIHPMESDYTIDIFTGLRMLRQLCVQARVFMI